MAFGAWSMRRSLRKMLRPGEKKEPRDFVCLGVEDHKDNSNDFKVPGRALASPGAGRLFLTLPSSTRSFLAGSPGMGGPGQVRAVCLGCACGPGWTSGSGELGEPRS